MDSIHASALLPMEHSREPAPLTEAAWAVLAGDGDAHPRRLPPRSAAPLAQGPPAPPAPPLLGNSQPSAAAFGAGSAAQRAARGAAAGERETATARVKRAPRGKATSVSGLSHDWDTGTGCSLLREHQREEKTPPPPLVTAAPEVRVQK